jgi:hypothetical protein
MQAGTRPTSLLPAGGQPCEPRPAPRPLTPPRPRMPCSGRRGTGGRAPGATSSGARTHGSRPTAGCRVEKPERPIADTQPRDGHERGVERLMLQRGRRAGRARRAGCPPPWYDAREPTRKLQGTPGRSRHRRCPAGRRATMRRGGARADRVIACWGPGRRRREPPEHPGRSARARASLSARRHPIPRGCPCPSTSARASGSGRSG